MPRYPLTGGQTYANTSGDGAPGRGVRAGVVWAAHLSPQRLRARRSPSWRISAHSQRKAQYTLIRRQVSARKAWLPP